MGNYAQSLYGSSLYGPNSTAADLVSGLDSTVIGYGSVRLTWSNPGSQWIRMRLVRSQYGFPATRDDGVVLFDVNAGPAATAPLDASITSYTDQMLAAPRFYYYSIFVSKVVGASVQWVRSGAIIGQSVADHGYTTHLLNRLPSIYTSPSAGVEELAGTASTSLSRFLSIIGLDVSRQRDFHDHLTAAWDAEHLHINLLPELLGTYNYSFEPMVGIRNNRAYTENAPFISQMKGTAASAVALGESITGYQVKTVPFVNLMLDENDASFEQSTGRWTVTGSATIARVTSPTLNDGTNPAAGSLQVTATANGSVDLAPADSGYGFGANGYGAGQYGVGLGLIAVKLGIPVSVGKSYTISAYVESAVNTTQPICDIQWFDSTGSFISTTAGVAGPVTGADFSARPSTTGVAPNSAAFAIPHLRLVSITSGDIFYVDHVQFEQAAAPSTYAPARQVVLRLIAPRINEVLNPGFDADVNNWTPVGATVTWDGTTTYNGGAGSAKVVPSGAGNAGLSTSFNVDSMVPYFAAAEIFSATAQSYLVSIAWTDKNNAPVRTDQVANLAVAANTWSRISMLGNVVPNGAVHGQLLIEVATTGTGATFWVDDVIVEQINLFAGDEYSGVPYGSGGYGGVLGVPNLVGDIPYGAGLFGGNSWGGTDPPRYFDLRNDSVDAKWEGTANASRLHLYPLFAIRKTRLLDLLAQNVPLGASSTVVWALGRPS